MGTTGYVFDETYLLHEYRGHPESPDRLRAILHVLEEAQTLDSLHLIEPAPVDRDLLEQIHPADYVDRVRRVSESGGGRLDADTYLNRASWDAALLAAGGAVDLTRAVLDGELDNGFALIRPPGHHAEVSRGMGFCLFNNVALAAQAALNAGLTRVLIVDFDVHHGNGTQAIFYDRADVLYFSTHQYPHYPGTGPAEATGAGEGEGYTINVPLSAGIGDDGYLRVFQEILTPGVRRYRPELILVSAGFDTHWQDPLAGMRMSVTGFARLAGILRDLAAELCEGRLVFSLEGGYHLEALSHGVHACVRTLLGANDVDDPLGPSPHRVRDLPGNLIPRLKQIHQLD